MPKNTGRNVHGTHTLRRSLASARAVAAATCDGVLDNGAGVMPSVIRPMTKPGRRVLFWGVCVPALPFAIWGELHWWTLAVVAVLAAVSYRQTRRRTA